MNRWSIARILAVIGTALAIVASAAGMVMSFPIIVIADSDLGTGAMQRVRDAAAMLGISLVALLIAVRLFPWARFRIGAAVLLLCVLAQWRFGSPAVPHTVRWPVMILLGMLVAAEAIEGRRRCQRPLRAIAGFMLTLAVPGVIVLSDWRGRLYFGSMPCSQMPSVGELQRLRTSISYMAGDEAAEAVSPGTRLKASGSRDGSLTVQGLDGGPAFSIPATASERMINVVCFSPDGKTLAVADNHRVNRSDCVVTIWDVTPGTADQPPVIRLRHTLRGSTHHTFSLDIFPDNRTIVYDNDRSVILADMESGRELARFAPHPHPNGMWDIGPDCVAASPDGRSYATWAWDSLKLWDRQSHRLLRRMDTRDSIGCKLAFSADGQQLFATDRSKTTCWDLHPTPVWFLFTLAITLAVMGWIVWNGSDGLEKPTELSAMAVE